MFLNVLYENSTPILNVEPTNNGYDIISGSERILYESVEDWNNISLKMANLEIQCFLENSNFILLEGEFLESIKDFFTDAWKKFQELFNAFTTWLQAGILTDKKFIEKFKSQLSNLNVNVPDNFSYNMVSYNLNQIHTTIEKGVNNLNSRINMVVNNMKSDKDSLTVQNGKDRAFNQNEKADESINASRGLFLGENKDYDETDFREELMKRFCNKGDTEKRDYAKSEIEWGSLVTLLSNFNGTINAFKVSKERIGQMYSKIISSATSMRNEVSKRSDNSKDYEKSEVELTKASANAKFDKQHKFNTASNTTETEKRTIDATEKIEEKKLKETNESGANNKKRSSQGYHQINNNIKVLQGYMSVITSAYGFAIKSVRRARNQSRGCLNKALVKSSNNANSNKNED